MREVPGLLLLSRVPKSFGALMAYGEDGSFIQQFFFALFEATVET